MTQRRAFTMAELLVVLAILGVVIAIAMPSLMRWRDSAARTQCLNNLAQIAKGVHSHHLTKGSFPAGMRWGKWQDPMITSGWLLAILPHVGEEAVWKEAEAAYRAQWSPYKPSPHPGLSRIIPLFVCPADPHAMDVRTAQRDQYQVALTSYLGVSGRDMDTNDGVLFRDSRIRMGDIRDGAANTLLAGERPGSPDFQYGWWYAGGGQLFTGSCDMILGAAELNKTTGSCPSGPYQFGPGSASNQCDMFHFWSQHAGGGGNFAFCDGSARFITYGAAHVMPALASRAGQDPIPEY